MRRLVNVWREGAMLAASGYQHDRRTKDNYCRFYLAYLERFKIRCSKKKTSQPRSVAREVFSALLRLSDGLRPPSLGGGESTFDKATSSVSFSCARLTFPPLSPLSTFPSPAFLSSSRVCKTSSSPPSDSVTRNSDKTERQRHAGNICRILKGPTRSLSKRSGDKGIYFGVPRFF